MKLTTEIDVKTYPNPFDSHLNVELSLPGYQTSNGAITVLDAVAGVIHQETVSWSNILETRLNTSNWTGGVY